MNQDDTKQLLDEIAIAAHGWAADARETYSPHELPSLVRRLRAKAIRWLAYRDSALAPLAHAWEQGYSAASRDAAAQCEASENPYQMALDTSQGSKVAEEDEA